MCVRSPASRVFSAGDELNPHHPEGHVVKERCPGLCLRSKETGEGAAAGMGVGVGAGGRRRHQEA